MDKDKYIGMMLDNRYELLEVIGTGGMAVVYKARCHRLNRLVAVKILKDEFAKDAEFRRRFHAESQAVAMLSNPNIVSVFDVSRTDQVEYIVMELIDGITMKQYMQSKGVLSWREALHFTTQIVKALSHAHSRGIIHRDIKPHNIMLLRDGSVKVADFGIARFTAKQNTLTQEALGSVHYISPEQARGSHIDARSDLYSVGVVMYEMTTGRLPFEGDTPVSIAIQHINSMPLSPREINPDIPVGLEQIILKAMAPNMSQRYASADEMLHDLEEFRKNPLIQFPYATEAAPLVREQVPPVTAQPVYQPPKPPVRQVQPQPSRNVPTPEPEEPKKRVSKSTVAIGAVAVVVLLIGAIYMFMSLLGGLGGGVEEIKMPDILYKNLDAVKEAFAASEEYKDLVIEENERVASTEYPEGTILEQTPASGRSIKKNGTVTVTVSKGNEQFQLKDFKNMEYKAAQIELTALDLKLAPLQYEQSDDIVEDYVIRTEPAAGSMVSPGDTITLFISQGPEVKRTKVPNLIDHTENEVARMLQDANLTVGLSTPVESDKPEGTVVWQSIAAETEVDEKTVIDYRVSKGPAESPSPSPTPTEEPPTQTPEPPTPTPQTPPPSKTVTKSFNLPEGEGTVLVLVTLDDNVVHNKTHDLSEGAFSVTFSVTGTGTLRVYYDSSLQYELNVP